MHIHFICTGNAYRSRLAECYLKSKQLAGVTVSSSGTEAEKHYEKNGPISWVAMRLIQKHRLIPFLKPLPETTTQPMLEQVDLLIFLSQGHYEYAKEHLSYGKTNYQVWNIPDLGEFPDARSLLQDERQMIEVAEKTFEDIRLKVEALIKDFL